MSLTFVGISNGVSDSNTTTAATPSRSFATGNHIFVALRWVGLETAVTISDTAGNVYTALPPAFDYKEDGYPLAQWFYCLNASGNAANVITATLGQARIWKSIRAIEMSGVAPIFVAASNITTGQFTETTLVSNTITYGVNSTLIAWQTGYPGNSTGNAISNIGANTWTSYSGDARDFLAIAKSTSGYTKDVVTYSSTTSTRRAMSVLKLDTAENLPGGLVAQQAIEALSNDADVKVRLDQQVVEVANAALPPVQVAQFSVEIPNTLAPPSQLAQFVVEVLSSSTSVVFDPSVAFWGLEPGGEVTERWQWKTDVQIARSGAQVRSCLRSEPRVQVEFNVATTTPSEMSLIDFIITGWQSKSYYLPIWQDRARLTSTLTSGGTTISTPLAGLGYADGDLIALWTSLTEYRVIQVADADFETDIITLAQPTGTDWPIGTFIAPVRRAWLSPQASAARFTGASMEARLVFDLEEPVTLERIEWDRDEGGPWKADSFALFSHRPNWSQAPRVDYSRRVDLLGDGTNRPWRYDVSGRSWITRSTLHTTTSRAEINRLLSWVAQRRGRAISYMAPVWDTAIEVTRSNTNSDVKLYVKTRNFQQFFAAINGRGYIALRDASGWIVRRITSAAQESGTEDVLNLAAAIGRAGTPAGWLDVVLCEPSHLLSDVLEVRWWDRTTAEVIIGHQQVIA